MNDFPSAGSIRTAARACRPTWRPWSHRSSKPGDHIAVLMWRLRDPWPIALELGDAYTYPMPSLWWLSALYPLGPEGAGRPAFHAPVEMDATERYLFDMTANNLVESCPRIIVMPRGSGVPGTRVIPDREFDVAKYLSQDPRVAALLARYVLESEFGRLAVWRRQDPGCASTNS